MAQGGRGRLRPPVPSGVEVAPVWNFPRPFTGEGQGEGVPVKMNYRFYDVSGQGFSSYLMLRRRYGSALTLTLSRKRAREQAARNLGAETQAVLFCNGWRAGTETRPYGLTGFDRRGAPLRAPVRLMQTPERAGGRGGPPLRDPAKNQRIERDFGG